MYVCFVNNTQQIVSRYTCIYKKVKSTEAIIIVVTKIFFWIILPQFEQRNIQ